MPDGLRQPVHPLWRAYRRWWVVLGISAALCLVLALLLDGKDLTLGNPRSWAPLVAFLCLGLAALQVLNFRCPSCGRQFHSRWKGALPRPNPLSRGCLNCGFPKWRDPPSRPR
jgi:hypothetical protein